MTNTNALREIARQIKTLSTTETEQFFQAFLTPKEQETLSNRYELIRALRQGIPQRKIAQDLNISLSQVTRGSTEMKFGVGREVFPKIFPDKSA